MEGTIKRRRGEVERDFNVDPRGVKYGRQCVEIVGNVGSSYGKARFRTDGL